MNNSYRLTKEPLRNEVRVVIVILMIFLGLVGSRPAIGEGVLFCAQGCEDGVFDPFRLWSGYARQSVDASVGALAFSNTQKWQQRHRIILSKAPVYLDDDWDSRIRLPSPPDDTSLRTQAELEYLLMLQETRDKAAVKQLRLEVVTNNFTFGPYSFGMLTSSQLPLTRKMFESAMDDFAVVVFSLKSSFDRVRPSFLDGSVHPPISVPAHPSYPSAHAGQSHMIVFLMEALGIARPVIEQCLQDACMISKRREMGGLHYPSDTAAGVLVARQFVDVLLQNPDFVTLLDDAKAEWPIR